MISDSWLAAEIIIFGNSSAYPLIRPPVIREYYHDGNGWMDIRGKRGSGRVDYDVTLPKGKEKYLE